MFPLRSFPYIIILPLITQTIFWVLKKSRKKNRCTGIHWILNFPLTCFRYIVYKRRLMLFVTNLTWDSFTSQNACSIRLCFVTLHSDLWSRNIFPDDSNFFRFPLKVHVIVQRPPPFPCSWNSKKPSMVWHGYFLELPNNYLKESMYSWTGFSRSVESSNYGACVVLKCCLIRVF